MKYYQKRAYYNSPVGEQTICLFWTDENGNVESGDLPSNREMCKLLKALIIKEVHVENTGKTVEDE